MNIERGEFTSRFGFIVAAAGSAVGLGNVWGFPSKAASNGGAAFVMIYLLMAFCLAYPALMAELIIGRHAKANAVNALKQIANTRIQRLLGAVTGYVGIATAGVILSFYAIVAGWMLAFLLAPVLETVGASSAADWAVTFGLERNLVLTVVFMLMTVAIVSGGVKDGIEKWSARLMPALLMLLLVLIIYVLTLEGAAPGLRVYLIPDLNAVLSPKLFVAALGQAFFSMSLGVGTMLIYGSYVSRKENLIALGRSVTLIDIGIAVVAGLLIIPAMYVAQENGVVIFDEAGRLMGEDTLIFTVLPALFGTMGGAGLYVSVAFFALMSIAALTSSISMLEVPVAYATENHNMGRKRASVVVGTGIMLMSVVLTFNFSELFGWAVAVSTQYSQPLLGLMLCLFAGWIWHRNSVLEELKAGIEGVENGWFWRIWPVYLRFVCPAAIAVVFAQNLLP